jgi:hypothetical protein
VSGKKDNFIIELITNVLDLNQSIIDYINSSKPAFRFIRKINAYRYRKDLIKKVQELIKIDNVANIVLTKDDVFEILRFIRNTYVVDHKFESIRKIEFIEDGFYTELQFNNMKYAITVYPNRSNMIINIYIKHDEDRTSTFEVRLESLYSTNYDYRDYIDDLNKELINIIGKLLIEIINRKE